MLTHLFQDTAIAQRPIDGYIHATAMCQANGKQLKHYLENKGTNAFLEALSRSVGIPADLLVQSIMTEKRGASPWLETWG